MKLGRLKFYRDLWRQGVHADETKGNTAGKGTRRHHPSGRVRPRRNPSRAPGKARREESQAGDRDRALQGETRRHPSAQTPEIGLEMIEQADPRPRPPEDPEPRPIPPPTRPGPGGPVTPGPEEPPIDPKPRPTRPAPPQPE